MMMRESIYKYANTHDYFRAVVSIFFFFLSFFLSLALTHTTLQCRLHQTETFTTQPPRISVTAARHPTLL